MRTAFHNPVCFSLFRLGLLAQLHCLQPTAPDTFGRNFWIQLFPLKGIWHQSSYSTALAKDTWQDQNQMHPPVTPPLQLWKSLPWSPKDAVHCKGSAHLGPSSYSYKMLDPAIIFKTCLDTFHIFFLLRPPSWLCELNIHISNDDDRILAFRSLHISTNLCHHPILLHAAPPSKLTASFRRRANLRFSCSQIQVLVAGQLRRHPKKHEEKEMFQWPKPDAHTEKIRGLPCELHGKSRTALDMPELLWLHGEITAAIRADTTPLS